VLRKTVRPGAGSWQLAVAGEDDARAQVARLAAAGRYDDVHDYSEACQRCALLVGSGGVTRNQLAEALAVMDGRDMSEHGLDGAERDGAIQALLDWGVDTRDMVAAWERAGEVAASLAEDQGRDVEPGEEPGADVLAYVPAPLRDAAREAWCRGWDDYADLVAADEDEAVRS
jgi:hypothetical protein